MEMDMENFLHGSLAIGKKHIHTLAAQATLSECRR